MSDNKKSHVFGVVSGKAPSFLYKVYKSFEKAFSFRFLSFFITRKYSQQLFYLLFAILYLLIPFFCLSCSETYSLFFISEEIGFPIFITA